MAALLPEDGLSVDLQVSLAPPTAKAIAQNTKGKCFDRSATDKGGVALMLRS